jgi:FkbM family methyltransferase
MKLVDGYCFPDHDIDCSKVIIGQSKDIQNVLKYVKDFDVCLQAGGNVGIWPKILSSFFGSVYTFEPDLENFDCLLANLHGISNVISKHGALSDKIETITVKSPNKAHDHNCGAYQVFEDKNGLKTTRIDDLNINPGLIYLDIEGYELKAFQGAVETIKRSKPVICFEDKSLPIMYGKKVGDVEKWLEDFGYKVVEKVHRDVICVYSS